MAYEEKKGHPTKVDRDEVWVNHVKEGGLDHALAPRDHTCEKWIDSQTGEEQEAPDYGAPQTASRRRR